MMFLLLFTSSLIPCSNNTDTNRSLQSSSSGIGDGGVVGSNLKGSHCLEAFDYSEKTIVRLNDSVNNGATFLDVDIVDTFELCLKWCCQTDVCNLAVWDQVREIQTT